MSAYLQVELEAEQTTVAENDYKVFLRERTNGETEEPRVLGHANLVGLRVHCVLVALVDETVGLVAQQLRLLVGHDLADLNLVLVRLLVAHVQTHRAVLVQNKESVTLRTRVDLIDEEA